MNLAAGGKAEHYRRLDTRQELLLIAQDEIHVQHYRRQDASRWLLSDFRESADRVELSSIDCTLILADIYEQTEPLP